MTKSARERLIRALNDDACTCGGSACPTAEQLVDAYAHELAEKIRVRCGELIDAAGPRATPSDPQYDRAAGFADAANLIDPEAQP
ncbi:hypothetical protein [Streptomyces sp. NPDC001492]